MSDLRTPAPIEVVYTEDSRTKRILREVEEGYPFQTEVSRICNWCNRDIGLSSVRICLERFAFTKHTDVAIAGTTLPWAISIEFNSRIEDCFLQQQHLPATLAHEFAHWARKVLNPQDSEYSGLADKVIDEGLAEHFQSIKYPGFSLRGANLSAAEINSICRQTQKMLWTELGSGRLWDWLKKHDEYIYVTGYEWISRFLEEREIPLKDLLGVPTSEVLEFLKIRRPLLQRLSRRSL